MIHLVLGGARSGKSRFAESVAQGISDTNKNKEITYIATATAGDDEMRARIAHHQASRPDEWQLIEETLYLSTRLADLAPGSVVIIECLTLWLTNWLCSENEQSWLIEKQAFLESLKHSQAEVILVSNEVGSGIVPLGELSREFVDQAGWLNQSVAAIADEVTLVVAGFPVSVKSSR
ncbi:MAG: bifunctional adenosylcobinamide kinase/adenosylcobinamide-phosphate guanylyltransferase [Kangiellaceae bacterium]|nr:bifunctional adenosylcobinamide kinase/adenosylcobinamide-phosphate guanylyltransferase [Kangiellaceae bacterium]MCW8999649.1 bifunctional adenosylcobinamide kinase/adenosylcobinamide-phosphate guanylyltransferase [Kangiellaceae bacterium]MCW9016781.1 bifunctional adenosylcobinamide kinase/adenosylcobinamide-phosphate guanylyltransferase [Kangiellaceae bacterium]